jgi:hypothetical protein
MKRNQTQKQEQNTQAEQKDKPIIRVKSGLRAGMFDSELLPAPCC